MAQVFRNFVAGRQLKNDETAYRNQLAQQQLANEQDARLMQMRETQFANTQADRTQQQGLDQEQRVRDSLGRVSNMAQHVLRLPAERRKGALQRAIPALSSDFQALGEDTSDLSELLGQADADLESDLMELAAFGAQGEPVDQWADEQGPRGTVLQRNARTGELRQVVAQQPSAPASLQVSFRTLSPQEVQQAGFPAGTVVQQNAQTGEMNVVTKRDNTGSLSQKDMTTARMKLNTVQLARQQLQAIKDRFAAGTRGADFFGPVAGLAPSPAGKSFDAAVDQMRSTLTALTRVPGVGAMSDYETRLDQAKFPSRRDWENVTSQKIQGIEDMLTTIERGYTDLLGGQPEQQQTAQAAPAVDVEALLNKYAPRQ